MKKRHCYRILMDHADYHQSAPDCWFGFKLSEARKRQHELRHKYPTFLQSVCLVECWKDEYDHWKFGRIIERNL